MTLAETLASGRAHHQAGRLWEAESVYRQVLAGEPESAEALYGLGLVALQAGQPAAGARLFSRAVVRRADYAEGHLQLGNALAAMADLAGAAAAYREAVRLDPCAGEAWANLACTLLELEQPDAAEPAARAAVRLRPDLPAAHNNLGSALLALGRPAEARPHFAAALQLRPAYARALSNLGRSFLHAGDSKAAIPWLEAARAHAPAEAGTLSDLGLALVHAGRAAEGEEPLRTALREQPEAPALWVNLGYALSEQEKWADAQAAYNQALTLAPEHGPACDGMATWHAAQGRSAEALAWQARALRSSPDDPALHWNRSLNLLLTGAWAEGWEEYEWRRRCPLAVQPPRERAAPLWSGEPLAGRRILLHTEQGAGDALQMARFVPLVAERGGRVWLEGPAALAPLLCGLPGVQGWTTIGETLPPFDLQCPFMSLPRAFGTRVETLPAPARYLAAPAPEAAAWRARLAGETQRKIGLVWAGAPHRKDRLRSTTLPLLSPLLALPGLRWFSVQKGTPASQAAAFPELTDGTAELHDFGGTAGLLENLDLLITVETGVAHLAGALGRPVWTLVPFAPDWRWGEHGEQSAWYPTMRLFRQRTLHGWPELVERVRAALAEGAP